MMAFATFGARAEITDASKPDFAPGQIWSIKLDRPTTAKVVVVRVEPSANRTVVHVSVIDIPIPEGVAKGDGITSVGEMPFDKLALAASVDQLLGTDGQPTPGFLPAYNQWLADGGAGVFTTGVARAVQSMLAEVYCRSPASSGIAMCKGQQGIANAAEDSDWSALAPFTVRTNDLNDEWTNYLNGPIPTLYYDTRRIEADHDIVRGYTLLNFNLSTRAGNAERMLSQIDYWGIDCTKHTITDIETTQYARHTGHGRVVYDHTFTASELKTTHYSFFITGSELKTAHYSVFTGASDLAQKLCKRAAG